MVICSNSFYKMNIKQVLGAVAFAISLDDEEQKRQHRRCLFVSGGPLSHICDRWTNLSHTCDQSVQWSQLCHK